MVFDKHEKRKKECHNVVLSFIKEKLPTSLNKDSVEIILRDTQLHERKFEYFKFFYSLPGELVKYYYLNNIFTAPLPIAYGVGWANAYRSFSTKRLLPKEEFFKEMFTLYKKKWDEGGINTNTGENAIISIDEERKAQNRKEICDTIVDINLPGVTEEEKKKRWDRVFSIITSDPASFNKQSYGSQYNIVHNALSNYFLNNHYDCLEVFLSMPYKNG